MEIKCLVTYNNKNYVIFLNGNRFQNLIDAIGQKKDLKHVLLNGNEKFNFFIFEEDFQTYILLDDEIKIFNLSKILIETNIKNNNVNILQTSNNYNLTDEDSDESTISIWSNSSSKFFFENDELYSDFFDNEKNLNSDKNLITIEDVSKPNLNSNQNSKNQLTLLKIKNLKLKNSKNFENEIEWTENDIVCLLNCCKIFSEELACYDISVELNQSKNINSCFQDKIWEQIAIRFQDCTNKLYNKSDCKLKFLNLRITYKNLTTFLSIENTYFSHLKYFEQLRKLIDRSKIKPNKIQVIPKPEYLAIINQVKLHCNKHIGTKYDFWQKITKNLLQYGFKYTGRYCQKLFYKLFRKYLALSETVSTEEEGTTLWPYFKLFQEIDLTRFTKPKV